MIPKNIDEQSPPFSYVHSDSLYRLLVENGISLLLTTYEAGKILLVRAGENQKLSLLLRHFEQPMGVAIDDFRLAIGGLTQIWEFHNAPEIGTQLDGNEEYDACFVPRCSHVTGDIRIHEMTWVDYNLVFVNTRFSCLSTIDRRYSFLPIWKPSFISCISAEDRCHLNGMADETGKIRYVTSLGKTDQQKGWRASKVDGGIIIDVSSHEIVSNGLSMPHSPRIYQGCLWVLNSGRGELQKVDITTGKRETLVRLPGFLRGLDFFGEYAFVGLSKIREKKEFGGLPIERLGENLKCGIAVINLEEGVVVGILEFKDGCNELFDVKVLPFHYPTIIGTHKNTINGIFVFDQTRRI